MKTAFGGLAVFSELKQAAGGATMATPVTQPSSFTMTDYITIGIGTLLVLGAIIAPATTLKMVVK